MRPPTGLVLFAEGLADVDGLFGSRAVSISGRRSLAKKEERDGQSTVDRR